MNMYSSHPNRLMRSSTIAYVQAANGWRSKSKSMKRVSKRKYDSGNTCRLAGAAYTLTLATFPALPLAAAAVVPQMRLVTPRPPVPLIPKKQPLTQ